MPRTIVVNRYVTPLREGGSLPAVVEADDDGLYVLKFRGAGQGPRALVAEWVSGEIARALGLPVPEIVFAQLDAELARTEGDPEIQDLIRASDGLNLAMDYLPGALAFNPAADEIDPALASRIVAIGLAPLRMSDRTAEWVLGGDGPAGASVVGSQHELFRAISGRRDLSAITALEWEGDLTPYLRVLSPYSPPE